MESSWSSTSDDAASIVTEDDLRSADSPCPATCAVMQRFPLLYEYIYQSMIRFRYNLGTGPFAFDLEWTGNIGATRVAAVAAQAMATGLWRHLLPRPGARSVLWSQTSLDSPMRRKAPLVFPVRPASGPVEAAGRSLQDLPSLKDVQRYAGGARSRSESPLCEHILDQYDLLAALQIGRQVDCLERYPVLDSYIERASITLAMSAWRDGATGPVAERVLHFTRNVARVSAVAVHRAVWGGLIYFGPTEEGEPEPELFDECAFSEDLPF